MDDSGPISISLGFVATRIELEKRMADADRRPAEAHSVRQTVPLSTSYPEVSKWESG